MRSYIIVAADTIVRGNMYGRLLHLDNSRGKSTRTQASVHEDTIGVEGAIDSEIHQQCFGIDDTPRLQMRAEAGFHEAPSLPPSRSNSGKYFTTQIEMIWDHTLVMAALSSLCAETRSTRPSDYLLPSRLTLASQPITSASKASTSLCSACGKPTRSHTCLRPFINRRNS